MSKKPITLYRLWCGRRCHGPWRRDRVDALKDGLASGVTFADKLLGGGPFPGPLVWIEVGQRKYDRSRTVTVGRQG